MNIRLLMGLLSIWLKAKEQQDLLLQLVQLISQQLELEQVQDLMLELVHKD
jgi:hypothetical protein